MAKRKKNSLKDIHQFLDAKRMAIAGVSRNPKKFGHQVFKKLQEQSYSLFPINPDAGTIDGVQVYASVSELPGDVKYLLIVTGKKHTEKLVEEAIAREIDHIWIQQHCETPAAIEIAEKAGIHLVAGECIFMWTEPVKGIHQFHKSIKRFFGVLPK